MFDDLIGRVLGHEGGYVNDPRDPGGETQFGISKRAYPNVDIKGLTRETAISIYKRDFWDRVQG
uniref:glycosyl hydrolase 108 family protein n=1 Tax=Klebsiella pneumoniae TaxID=573 RepID=UPI0039E582BF